MGLCLAAGPANASDGVLAPAKLSDIDFYDLATCGAIPGQNCKGPRVRWPKARVTVAMHPDTGTMSPAKSDRVSQALDRAIATINAAGARISLVRDANTPLPDIMLRRVSLRPGDLTKDIPNIPDGLPMGVGFSTVWWVNDRYLTKATILISAHILRQDVVSVVLEELFQSLGFRYDVEGRYYENRSILAQDSNSTTTITGQDAAILRLHYPPASN